jgi:arabinofuranosyltransferase
MISRISFLSKISQVSKRVMQVLESIHLSVFLLWGMFGVVLVRTAWLGDDAFITLRTVDNFVNGYGLTWNIVERVQSYTHPLWMFLLIGLYFFTHEAYYTTLILSILVSLATFLIVMRFVKNQNLATLSLLGGVFLSKSFVDYSTSGLENPLSHLLFAVFLLVLVKSRNRLDAGSIFLIAFVTGLATLNRMDTLLLYIPPLLWVLWKNRSLFALRLMFLGFLPFVVWEIFSIIYYGFPFPNTAYAKLGINLPRMDLLEMGYLYFLNSLHWDPITLTIISLSIGWSILRGSPIQKSIAAGLILYLFYILWIGGDHMSGRFFSVVFLGSIVILLLMLNDIKNLENVSITLPILVFFLAVLAVKPSYDTGGIKHIKNGISDERNYYFAGTGLVNDAIDTMAPSFDWAQYGVEMRYKPKKVEVFGPAGMMPYYAGHKVYFVDDFGLTNPLLARLPPIPDGNHRVGHFYRGIPEGYLESVIGENQIEHPALALYYDKLRLVTRGSIWSWQRFVTIWELNTGKYDYLLEQYSQDVIFTDED